MSDMMGCRLSTAFVHRQQIEAVDFYSDNATPPGALGGKHFSG
jgi:hypothetical protein